MKAITQDRYGTADVLEFREVVDPLPGPEDVLVRVRAAGCGPDVWHLMTGLPYFVRAMPGFHQMRAGVRGTDVGGVIDAVGSNVTGLGVGDEVMGYARGSFAELAVAPAAKLVRKPERLSFEQAAAVPVSGVTALQALRDEAKVRPGQTVLVIGAAGGVGSFAVQIARAFGASVTGVCGATKLELVRSLGADEVIDYTKDPFLDGSRRWDAIVDTAGRRPLSQLRGALAPEGTLAIVGGEGGDRWTGGFGRQGIRAPLLSLFTGQRLRPVVAKERGEDLEDVRRLIEAGDVTPVVDRTFALSDAAAAVRYLAEGHAAGKIVITVET